MDKTKFEKAKELDDKIKKTQEDISDLKYNDNEKYNDENWEQTFREKFGIPEGYGEEIDKADFNDKYYWSIKRDNSGIRESWYAQLEEL